MLRSPKDQWLVFFPVVLLPGLAILSGHRVPAWAFMWALALAFFLSLKWLTWWNAQWRSSERWRSAGYLLLWPGMNAESFLESEIRPVRPPTREWLGACFKTALGVLCLWFFAGQVPTNLPLLRGWIGMLGLVLLLHFGIFHVVALAWQSLGVAAEPIMRAPLRSHSLSEFWGKRWNLGFRQLSHTFIFVPLHRRLGTGFAGFLVFIVSGLLHDLVISVPARGGYGLPTLYFAIQGGAIVVERSTAGRRFGLGRGKRGWLFMAAITAGPAFWLFHPPFVHNVILPFMKAIGALR